jgi:nicotinate phosphoribosyltransferase
MNPYWIDDEGAALLTDFYELTMMQAYFNEGMREVAVFDLFVRRLPDTRNYLIACGLDAVLHYLETLRFSGDSMDYLRSLQRFSPEFLDALAALRFTGDVYAIPEGTPVFPQEPLLEIIAPIVEAQLLETFLINQVHFATLMASKASRIVTAAQGRTVVDFGVRRMHGADAGLKAARAFYIAGVEATSNVAAGARFGIPVSGTMAHSYIQAHDSEYEAFKSFVRTIPFATLLVDTYDTIEGVRRVIRLAQELGAEFQVSAIRLDSGDLAALAWAARQLLDDAGLSRVKIIASSGLDEYEIARLLEAGAPIDGFGVGTSMGVSADAPYLDVVYKLVEYAGRPRLKRSTGKATLPGRKQVYRQSENGAAVRDVLACRQESAAAGTALLQPVMIGGRRLNPPPALADVRAYCRRGVEALPARLLRLKKETYPVVISPQLQQLADASAD